MELKIHENVKDNDLTPIIVPGSYAKCEVSVSETVVNLSDGDGVQLACLLQTSDQKLKLEI